MGNVIMLVAGMVLLVVGAQGGIRLLADRDDEGLLGWLPGGFAAHLAYFALMTIVGVAAAARGGARMRGLDPDP